MTVQDLVAPTTPGQLIDRITILRMKVSRAGPAARLSGARAELQQLLELYEALCPSEEVRALERRLGRVNAALWDCEDEVRDCEHRRDFGERFIRVARLIPRLNDRRCALKRRIDQLLGAAHVERKLYRTA